MSEDVSVSHSLKIRTLKEESDLCVPMSEWNSLKSKVNEILPAKKIYGIVYSVCFGVAGSAFLSLIPNIPEGDNPYSLIFFVYLLVGIAALLVGLVVLVLDFQQKVYLQRSSASIVSWMQDYENRFKDSV